jgi:hypothetical protein
VISALPALVAAVAVIPATAGAAAFKATLSAPTHTPKAGVKWWYRVRATDRAGKPIAARLTAQIVDPAGGAHYVQYDGTKRNIRNRPFRGVFRDYIIWPASSRGIPLQLRLAVKAKGATITLRYRVTAR